MRFKTYTGITWSLLELKGLLEDEESRVYFEKSKKHFGLHPFHLTNLNASLNEILSSNLNSYDAELKGFLLAYQNPKLLTPLGEIFYDTCFIHVDIQAEFYVFRPEVGCCLKGTINKKGLDHIGVLVHKAFNVSIPKPEDQENWLGDNLEIGQEVKFTVTFLDFNSKLPFIRGSLDSDNYLQGCKLTEKKLNQKTLHGNVIENNVENVHSMKQKKQRTFFSTDSENSSNEDAVQVKKETFKQNKQGQLFNQDDVIECNDKNEDKKSIKKVKESRLKSIKVETMQKQHVNNNSTHDSESEQQLEKISPLKKNIKKKSTEYTSQSSIDEDIDIKPGKSPKKTSKKLSNAGSKNEIRKIKLEGTENINGKHVKEEIISENRSKLNKKSKKRKYSDETDNSVEDLTVDKYMKNASKKTTEKETISNIDNNEIYVKVKTEPFNNYSVNEINDKVKETPNKKKHKTPKKFENNQEELCSESISTPKKTSESSMYVSSSNFDNEEETENNIVKKKRKKHSRESLLDISEIKVESDYEDIIIKVEKPDDGYSHNKLNENFSNNSAENVLKTTSPKKKHKTTLDNISVNDETDHEVDMKYPKNRIFVDKDLKVQNIKIKKEKSVMNTESDEDQINKFNQKHEKVRNSKNSPNKQSSVSQFDISKVKVKIERSTDS
ncbi:RNA polymerase I subunit F isoform X1 [Nomia melanderi]|uniref:RNA polymerase I subunit F isoform X1 n=1 Tax=Nomia melanderi TaxID=2448451 RepID=UPI003FCD1567